MLAQTQRSGLAPAGSGRTAVLSRAEAEMMVRIVRAVSEFATGFPVEFHAYCPVARWEPILAAAAQAVGQIETQLASAAKTIVVPLDLLMSIVDLEECVSGARDARLSNGKVALIIATVGVIGQSFFGLTYLATPAYIIALAISLGRPLLQLVKGEPAAPFVPDTVPGARITGLSGGGCSPAPSLGHHTSKAKVIERVIVSPERRLQRFHWGSVTPMTLSGQAGTCLVKGEWRVRVEGWGDDRITLTDGWEFAQRDQCFDARNEISVREPCGVPARDTGFGDIQVYSGHEKSIWAEYVGPFTEGTCRVAGPFG